MPEGLIKCISVWYSVSGIDAKFPKNSLGLSATFLLALQGPLMDVLPPKNSSNI